MKLRKILFTSVLLLTAFGFAQNSGNSHFTKLLVMNQKQEVLLINFDGSWEIPGSRYKKNTTIPLFLDEMSHDHGIKVKNHKLAALVTFHHEVRDRPTMMLYYTAVYDSGKIKTPSWGQDVKWFKLEDAYKLIPYQEMVHIMKAILKTDEVLTGALTVEYDENTKRTGTFKIIDPLN